jgi:chromosome segregation ATPase
MTDEELKQLVASLAVSHREIAQSQRELTEQQKRTDAQLAKTDAQLAKTDAQLAKTDAQLEKTSRKLDRLGELVGNISNNQGDIAEEFFYQSFVKKPILGTIKFDSVSRNMNNHIGNLQEEYDLVLINGDTLAVIEVKAKAHVNDLEKMITKKVANFPKLFRVYQDYHLYAGVATLVTNDDLIAKAQELGLFLLTQQGDHTAIVQTGRLLH